MTRELPSRDSVSNASPERPSSETESLTITLDSIGDGVIATDETGVIVRVNPAAERLTGWSYSEAKGKLAGEILTLANAETRSAVENPVAQTLRSGLVVALPKHTVLTRRDGSEIPITDSCASIRAKDGSVRGAVWVFRDLTAQESAEAADREFQTQVAVTDRLASVGILAAGVAHEMNNPLGYAAANVETAIEEVRAMSGGAPVGRMRELENMLVEAREGVVRVANIVRELKTFSRVEVEKDTVFDVAAVIELSVKMASSEICQRAKLVKEIGAMPRVHGDDARLGQVFINLLVNAAHAIPEGNTETNEIRIVASTDGSGRAIVEVRDTGPGIEPGLLARIFDPFFTTKPIGRGTGLGLAISRNIVTAMGGELSVDSERGRGTTFRVSLPPSRAPQPTMKPVAPHSTPAPSRAARVLVVDDEPAIGAAIHRVLRGHDVTVVTSGREALALLATGKEFDVVLSDLMMPEMSGMALHETLAKLHPQLASKVVFVTGGAFTREANAYLDRLENERLEKPFDAQKLRQTIQRIASC